ncbi:chitobiase/beta-hexosaminidase C-terminal domain-containing protein [Paenibacillus tepidiphilus]|uniref:chitobiase/beta-hexosaminidase C-terminal domain-containing protein n=1 Tax=Paenibacillus tepidiphilus TaxID=2608683 RepID=UPI00123A3E12|nr:chitobiase/beta-hexosaminidase C-terminal domain-containing protein [Paenibacillus tepidiphilus]
MASKRKALIGYLIALAVIAIAGVAGGIIAKADPQTWSGAAETGWYDSTYDTFKINDEKMLAGVAKLVNEGMDDGLKGKILEITRDLDLSEFTWVPIGTGEHPFRGTLITEKGAIITISGMKVVPNVSYQGLVGNMEGGTVGRLTFTDTGSLSVTGVTYDVYAGSAVGKMSGSSIVFDITNNLDITVNAAPYPAHAGGIVGMGEGMISNSFNNGDVTVNGTGEVGGIIGYVDSRGSIVKKVGNAGNLLAQGSADSALYAGGIAGRVSGALSMNDENTPIVNSGSVNVNDGAKAVAGGIVGQADASIIFSNATSNQGAVTISSPAAALSAAGALMGAVGNAIIPDIQIDFANTAPVTNYGGTDVYTGGIAGYSVTRFTWRADYNNAVTISASGTQNIYTGGIAGYTPAGLVLPESAAYTHTGELQVTGGSRVYTGGIVGYDVGGSLGGVSFKGSLNAAGTTGVYSGGIAGYEAGGTIAGAAAGNTAEAHASISADGTIGGIAGYLDGTLSGAQVQDLTLQATAAGGVVGGIAGNAQGTVTGVTSGDADSEDYATVIFKAAGQNDVTYGGLVGLNEKSLLLTEGRVSRTAFLTEAGTSGYTMGGAAGKLADNVLAGTAAAPLEVQDIRVEVQADSTSFGGAVGSNATAQIYAHVNMLEIGTTGNSVQAGGLLGLNQAVVPHNVAENVTIAAQGANNRVGGYAGTNTGMLIDAVVNRLSIEASGTGAEAGGIAGHSEGSGMRAVISKPILNVVDETNLITASGADTAAGAIVGSALATDITVPEVNAVTPLQAMIIVQADKVKAGGLAGALQNTVITGDTKTENLENLYLLVEADAEDTYVGGLVGYNEESTLDKLVGTGINMVLNGPRATAGGIAGYNRSSSSAIIVNTYLTGLALKANAGAASSVIGGIAGLNDAQSSDPVLNPAIAVSTMQNTRTLGTVAVTAPLATVGGMVGENRSLIANNSITDKLPVSSKGANSVIGGLAGLNTASGTLYYTYSNANLTIEGAGTLGGGLVGENAGTVKGSYVDIDVTGKATGTSSQPVFLGGLIGRNNGGTVELSYSASNVKADGVYTIVGGLVGEHAAGNIKNSYVAKTVSANKGNSYAGGFIGRITNGKVSNVYSAAEVNTVSGSYAGGFAGRYDNSSKELLYKSYYIKDASLNINKDLPDFAEGNHRWLNVHVRLSTILSETLKDREEFPGLSGWDFTGAWKYGSLNATYRYPEVNREANTGGETGNNVNANINWYMKDKDAISFQITSEAELAGLAAIVNGTIAGVDKFNFADRTIAVLNPIHIQSKLWVPIGDSEENAFQGTFDGGNQLIDGLTLQPVYTYSGLFGVIGKQGAVQHMVLEPVAVSGNKFTGTLAGLNLGKAANVDVKLLNGAKISGGTVGGIIGKNTGEITALNLTLNGGGIETVGNEGTAGGIIGDNTGDIIASTYAITAVDGSIGSAADGAIVGGVIGTQSGNVTGLEMNVTSAYKIAATGMESKVGGLIGYYSSGTASALSLSFTDGTVEARGLDSVLGGVIGQAAAGTVLSGIQVDAPGTGVQLTGNGTMGGVVGVKEGTLGGLSLLSAGSGSSSFDLEQLSARNLNLASTADSMQAVIGGLAGELSQAALNAGSYQGAIQAAGEAVMAGGIAGQAGNSVVYDVKAQPELQATGKSGEAWAGGIAGSLASDHLNQGFDFGKAYPLYNGIYLAEVTGGSIGAFGTDNQMDVYAGGLAGRNDQASIYRSASAADISAGSGKTVNAGGIAGYSNGIIVDAAAAGSINADNGIVYNVGGIAGWAEEGEIHHSKATASGVQAITVGTALTLGDLLPATHAGGIVGMGDNVKITYTRAGIPLNIKDSNQDNTIYTGGFAGLLGENSTSKGLIKNSYATGAVTVSGKLGSYTGGFAGSVDHFEISDSYASGVVINTGLDTRTGGFAGSVDRGALIERSYGLQSQISATGIKSATRSYIGGFAGYNDGTLSGIYANVAAITNNVQGADAFKGALVGYNFRDGKVLAARFTGDLAAAGHNAGGTVVAEQTGLYNPLDSGLWNIEYDTSFMDGAFDGTVTLNTPQQLRGAAMMYNPTGEAYYQLYNRTATDKLNITTLLLGADIDLAGASWIPFSDFTGTFDGQGHTISGLRIQNADLEFAGFVSENQGQISNINFADAVIAGGTNAAVAAGINHNGASLSGITLSGKVHAAENAGGAAGVNDGSLTDVQAEDIEIVLEADAVNAGGIAGINNGSIAASGAQGSIAGGKNAGGIAGTNTSDISGVTFVGSVEGEETAGGISGKSTGAIADSESRDSGNNVSRSYISAPNAGGIAGTSEGSITGSKSASSVGGLQAAGGIAGTNNGTINLVSASGAVTGSTNAGGIAGVNQNVISTSTYTGSVAGQETAGGIAGVNQGEITDSNNSGDTISSEQAAGGIAGISTGTIGSSDAHGNVTGPAAGGVAGVNSGSLNVVSFGGSVQGDSSAGGIAGDNEGNISEAVSYGDVSVTGNEAAAGGISGVNTGDITDSQNAGRVVAAGTVLARAGGIAGYAKEGLIASSLNTGEIKAGIGGIIAPGKAFFGGIAGQKTGEATISNTVFAAQMLKNKTAYFNESGQAVAGAAGEAVAMTSAELAKGIVPQALASSKWSALFSFYPGLSAYKGTDAGLLSTAAVLLDQQDLINRVNFDFALSTGTGLSWSADPAAAVFQGGAGSLVNGSAAKLTVQAGAISRTIAVNEPAFRYPQTAAAPTIKSMNGENILVMPVVLETTEPGGIIYYTLDGSVPTETSLKYTGPIELQGQTTVKAITIAEGKEYSSVVGGTWTPQASGGGGGGFVPVPQPEPAITAVAGTVTQIGDSEAPLKVARGSKLKLSAPEGQVIYYTTDGSAPTDKSTVYTGELLITRSMTIKMITSEDDTVITIQYEVENAQYHLKENSAEIKYMTAAPNGLFKPNATITRFETIGALAPLLDMEEVDLGSLFNDVPAEHEALTSFFASAGIVEGYPDGGFGGEKGLTRAEFSKIVAVMLKLDTQTPGAAKQSDLKGHWSEAYVNALTAAGYIQGFPDGTFKPNAPITRAQAVVLINRIAGTKKLPAAAARFTDVPASHWAFKDIMSAVQ